MSCSIMIVFLRGAKKTEKIKTLGIKRQWNYLGIL